MRTLVLASLLLGLLSCSKNGSEVVSLWTYDQKAAFVSGCQNEVKLGSPSITDAAAAKYCSCIIHQIASRWSFADYAREENTYWNELEKAGVVDACIV